MEVKEGRHCEAASEGSVEQNRDLANRNRICGILGRIAGSENSTSLASLAHAKWLAMSTD
tara:strand:+ start:767 stop:946 length:180 start_codon:yes stop_codon:yes gene_type:complete